MTALEGVRVLDFTTGVAGPNCTKLLADFGADVIKVEPPAGDVSRMTPPFAGDIEDCERSLLFLHLNTNKRSVTLDLTTSEGAGLAGRLAATAQLIVEDADPGVMASLGLGREALAAARPELVYVSITPWGQSGPYAERGLRASELTLQGMGGPAHATGDVEREPLKLGGSVAHMQAGAVAAYAATMTLFRAERGGGGDHVDISIYETQAGTRDRRTVGLTAYAYQGTTSKPLATSGIAVAAGVKPTADGYINLRAIGAARMEQFVQMIGRDDLAGDPRLGMSPVALDPAFVEELQGSYFAWLLARGKREVVAEAQERGLLAGIVNTPEDLVSDPHYRGRGVWEEISHPVAGSFEYPGRPFVMSATPRAPARPAPMLGQHTDEVLGDLGVSAAELADLRARHVIGEA